MKKLLLLLSIVYTQEITNITLEQRADGSGVVDVCYDLAGTEDFSLFFITAEINFNGEWLPVSGASGDIGPTIEVGSNKCFEWNVKSQYPERYSDNVQIRIHANSDAGLCIDIDGNQYEIIQIGEQLWMSENLKTTHYQNGDPIRHITNNGDWGSYGGGLYGVYNNDPANADTYGNLYNWAVVEDSRGVCPEDWHIPSDDEFKTLEMFLGMSESEANDTGLRGTNEGGKMKETGLEHWNTPNTGATNESGFNGFPAGYRSESYGNYYSMGNYGFFWSSTELTYEGSSSAWNRVLNYFNSGVNRDDYSKQYGLSVRCLKD